MDKLLPGNPPCLGKRNEWNARAVKCRTFQASLTKIFICIVLLLMCSSMALASHFRGGNITYKYLGSGRYEFTIKGYWHKSEVGSISPRYQGLPALSGAPVTVSKTLLPDGETVEHVQRQTVTWAQPGTYEISWRTCCRGVGSNYNNNENGLFAAVAYNPNVASSSPQFSDYPLFNYAAGQALEIRLGSSDPDGHELEYTLQTPYGLGPGAYDEMLSSGFQVDKSGTIKWANPVAGKWLVNIRLREKVNGSFTGAYLDREFILHISSAYGNAPVFTPLQPKTVRVGQTLSFEVEASDSYAQNITLSAYGAALSSGAGFNQTHQGNPAKGVFSWTPAPGATGYHRVQFVATNSLQPPVSSQVSVDILVEPCKVSAAYTTTAKPCAGSNNGSIAVSATDGVAPYNYSIDNGATYQPSPDFNGLSAGSYEILVRDADGCTSEPLPVVLDEAPKPTVLLSVPSAVCADAGTVALTGGSPAGGLYYGTGVENGYFYPGRAGVGTHIIYYTYTNNNGCSSTASATITVNTLLVAHAGPDQTINRGNCAVLTANATDGGGTYTFRWSTGATTQSISVCPTETTAYSVTVTDATGCTSTAQVTVIVVQNNGGGQENKPVDPGPPTSPGPPTNPGPPENPGPPTSPGPPDNPGTPGGPAANGNGLAATGNSNALSVGSAVVSDETAAELVVYPNPITDVSKFSIIFNETGFVAVDILDVGGNSVKQLYSGKVDANQQLTFEINRSLGRKGMYIGRVLTARGVQYVKLLLQ